MSIDRKVLIVDLVTTRDYKRNTGPGYSSPQLFALQLLYLDVLIKG
jgi:hypothetical protein